MWTLVLSLLKLLSVIMLPLILPLLLSFVFWFIYWVFIKKVRIKKGKYSYVGYGSFLKRLFIDFPKQLIIDWLKRDPDFFREYGIHIVAGEQGSGKTITVAYMLMRFQKMYPKLKVKTNFNYVYQDGEINHWHDVIASENGIYGEIDVIDEVQNWFNSLQSKDFPIEMMTEITQQRKQRKCIIGTSQVFTRVAKPIREQTYVLYEPVTIAGCLTIVRKYKPEISADSGIPDSRKYLGTFFFVHSKELRESYDTYLKIEKMAKEGFKSDKERITT
jgi:ATP-dependent Clp protease ATP-binding subunit ClpX